MSRAPVDLRADFSGIGVHLRGLPADCEALARERWRGFLDPAAEPILEFTIRPGGGEMDPGPFRGEKLETRVAGNRVRIEMDEGRCTFERGSGQAELQVHEGDAGHRFFGIVNLMLAAMAWELPVRGAALMHAGGIAIDGAAFALVGQSGAGKTTWVRLARDGGALPLSDDLLLLDTSGDQPELLGSPFRIREFGSPGAGRWPLAAVLFSSHGEIHELTEVSPLLAQARLGANFPWVGERIGEEGSPLAEVVRRLVAGAPVRQLTFRRDGGFLPLLRALARPGG